MIGAEGFGIVRGLLSTDQCAGLVKMYPEDEPFRSRVIMQRHGFGSGEYKYFGSPLPPLVAKLRAEWYPRLAPIANQWGGSYPGSLEEFTARCAAAGQTKPTPLLLRYTAGDYNCLHQDLYGEHVFPLQLAILLSKPGEDFTGGEFVLTEQRPRMQSRVTVVPLSQGDGVVFPVRYRPVAGTRGTYRVNMRHGVSTVRSGERYTVGIIFHDAK